MTDLAVRDLIQEAAVFEPEPPRPLRRLMPRPEPFPVGVLGDYLAPAANAIHQVIQAPLSICAQAVLSAATLAVQPHIDVVMPYGQRRPVSEYFISIADSGERKTAADDEALWPVRRFETCLREGHAASL